MTTTSLTRERQNIIAVWALLVVLTLVSWWLGTDHGGSAETATTIVILVSFVKVLMVGNTFMELRHAILPLRMAFGGLCVTICTVILVLYHAN